MFPEPDFLACTPWFLDDLLENDDDEHDASPPFCRCWQPVPARSMFGSVRARPGIHNSCRGHPCGCVISFSSLSSPATSTSKTKIVHTRSRDTARPLLSRPNTTQPQTTTLCPQKSPRRATKVSSLPPQNQPTPPPCSKTPPAQSSLVIRISHNPQTRALSHHLLPPQRTHPPIHIHTDQPDM